MTLRTTLVATTAITIIAILIGSAATASAASPTLADLQNQITALGQRIDSFFDIFTEFQKSSEQTTDNLQNQLNQQDQRIDSFFDVFTEIQKNTQLDEPTIFLNVHGIHGQIQGDVTKPGRENTIGAFAFSHDIQSPRDPASGLPTGKRQHAPIVITKEIDKSTPLLFKALVNNENLDSVKFDFYRSSSNGAEEKYFTIELQNAQISDIKSISNTQRATMLLPDGETESISFVYQKIIWTWVDGGITAEDDWEAPVV